MKPKPKLKWPAEPASYEAPATPELPPIPSKPATRAKPGYEQAHYVFAADLLNGLTDALQAQDEKKFLSFFGGKAHRSAWFWWQNQKALGMLAGAVGVYGNNSGLYVDDKGEGILFDVMLGTHLPGDPVDADGKPVLVTSWYQWKIATDDRREFPHVIKWTPMYRDPWDCLCLLAVEKTDQGIIAAYPDEADYAAELVPNLTEAVQWSALFYDAFGGDLGLAVDPVVFATRQDDRYLSWHAGVEPQPEGQPTAANVSGYPTFRGLDPKLNTDYEGLGSRMFVGSSVVGHPGVLVHELAHYGLNGQNHGESESLAAAEGFAGFMEHMYEGTSLSMAEQGDYQMDVYTEWGGPDIAGRIAGAWTGNLPTNKDFRKAESPEALSTSYGIAATYFDFLYVTWGGGAALDTISCVYRLGESPFACVPNQKAKKPGVGVPGSKNFLPAKSVKAKWQEYVEQTYIG